MPSKHLPWVRFPVGAAIIGCESDTQMMYHCNSFWFPHRILYVWFFSVHTYPLCILILIWFFVTEASAFSQSQWSLVSLVLDSLFGSCMPAVIHLVTDILCSLRLHVPASKYFFLCDNDWHVINSANGVCYKSRRFFFQERIFVLLKLIKYFCKLMFTRYMTRYWIQTWLLNYSIIFISTMFMFIWPDGNYIQKIIFICVKFQINRNNIWLNWSKEYTKQMKIIFEMTIVQNRMILQHSFLVSNFFSTHGFEICFIISIFYACWSWTGAYSIISSLK